jgi:hypothetical protein
MGKARERMFWKEGKKTKGGDKKKTGAVFS